jgi:hypothetical protein
MTLPDGPDHRLTLVLQGEGAEGEEFLLSRLNEDGSTSEMLLGEADVRTLAQAAQRVMAELLARRSPKGGTASLVLVTPVAQVRLNTDLHQSEIHLGLIDGKGAEAVFVLAPDVARLLAERLPMRLEQIEQARPTRQ